MTLSKENIVCGKRVIREVIKQKINIEILYVSKTLNRESISDIIDYVKEIGGEVKIVCSNDIDNICENRVNQGIACKISGYKFYKFDECLNELKNQSRAFVLILDGIQDPQNLGSIIRSAECMGIKHILIPQKRSVGITDVVWKASMGAVAHLKICRVNNLYNAILRLKENFFKVVATTIDGENYVNEIQYDFNVALVIGNEHQGIRDSLVKQCDIKVKIPMYGSITSFNASVAAGIVMYEIKNKQRR